MNYLLSTIAVVELLYIVHLIYDKKHYERAMDSMEQQAIKTAERHLKYLKDTESKVTLLEKALDQRTSLVEELETKLAIFSEDVVMGKPPRAKKPNRKPKITK
jgi:hypothetical protein